MLVESIRSVQADKNNQDGAYFVEIQNKQVDQVNHLVKTNPLAGLLADMTLTRLVCGNKVWTNKDFTKFSLVSLPGFRNWEDYMAKDFKGYKVNESLALIPDTAPLQNFDKIMTLLRSPTYEGNEDAKEFEALTK